MLTKLCSTLTKQIKYSNTFQKNVNNLTAQTNKLLINIQLNQNLDSIKDGIETIMDNIHSAKSGLMSPFVLTKDEISDLNISFNERINVFTKENIILFVINIPIRTQLMLSYYVRQIPNQGNAILKIDINDVVLF